MIIASAGVGTSIFLYFLIPGSPVFLAGLIPVLVGASLLAFASLLSTASAGVEAHRYSPTRWKSDRINRKALDNLSEGREDEAITHLQKAI